MKRLYIIATVGVRISSAFLKKRAYHQHKVLYPPRIRSPCEVGFHREVSFCATADFILLFRVLRDPDALHRPFGVRLWASPSAQDDKRDEGGRRKSPPPSSLATLEDDAAEGLRIILHLNKKGERSSFYPISHNTPFGTFGLPKVHLVPSLMNSP